MSAPPADPSLVARIKRVPRPDGGGKAEARLQDLRDPGLADVLLAFPAAKQLIAVLAEYSPYLWELASQDPRRLATLLRADPDRHFPALLEKAAEVVQAASDEGEVMRLLRHLKAEASLLIALADIGNVWDVMQVTRAMTLLADGATASAVRHLLADAVARGKLKPADPRAPEKGSGYIVLAMGKMGAFELNYSSDIDLIVFFDPAAPALVPEADALATYLRVTKGLVKLLGERTADGYVFRVDLRLRPDPASTHIAVSIPAALDYYESRGQNWERSAMIKARPCAGDLAAGEAFLKDLAPFVWRKYMDFIAVADIHAMKRQIHDYKGHGEIAVAGHNVKLGRGGIREIEFFVQTQQLIAGGRNPHLRSSDTLTTLEALAQDGWIDQDACRELKDAYLYLRRVEHRLQMIADEQTHTLPTGESELLRFAHFLGYPGVQAFSEELLFHLRIVQGHYSRLFESSAEAARIESALLFPEDADDPGTLDQLAGMGFRDPAATSGHVRRWLSRTYPSLRHAFVRDQLAELVPVLLHHLSRSENRDGALLAFDRFLQGLHAGGRLFSLLRQNPDLVALIARTLGAAPRLADILAHYPQVMDGLIDPAFFGSLPDHARLTARLTESLKESSSYEDFLDRLRLFGQEHMFLIGARILSGTVSAEQVGEAFATLADVVIQSLHHAVEERFAVSHGHIRGHRMALLALGKLGGREMTAGSDLDLILVYDFDEEHPESDGPKPLYGAQYFARLTQRLISALTAQTNYGALYPVDMRLRPSGRSGPVATQISAFESYQETEAWTWEHMALTRARVVSASPDFGERVESVIQKVLCRRR
ncbi:MAG: bifunctional [glutamine synthetase] adenylyltransferase/[glutamine synthetase]-adenylyl-L-tyrosine phosphorylase, partial [Pseudorhodoplanes sp.]